MQNRLEFGSWLLTEETNRSKNFHVFFDMDETLVATMETGWIKDHPENKDYISISKSGQDPFPDVVTARCDGKQIHIFPRPGLRECLEAVKGFASIHILSHAKMSKIKAVFKALKLNDLIPVGEMYSTRDEAPGDLKKKYDLDNNWVLVDNLWPTTVEMISKMRILGLNFPERSPREESELIANIGKKRFVHVKEYRAEVSEDHDFELFRAVGEIRKKLGLAV